MAFLSIYYRKGKGLCRDRLLTTGKAEIDQGHEESFENQIHLKFKASIHTLSYTHIAMAQAYISFKKCK